MTRRRLMNIALLALPGLLLAGPATAQDFPPKKAVTMVVGFAPGGAADSAARLIARKLGENIGQTVIVDNKAVLAATSRTSRWPTARWTAR